jgi:hypothetical protein
MGALISSGGTGRLEKSIISPRPKRGHVPPLAKALIYPMF